jgi:endonuclease/exonuclease/phosphatase (EEP) superfamily protein YafD
LAYEISVVSCNLAKKDAAQVRREFDQVAPLRDADLWLLQEMEDPALPAAFSDRFPYHAMAGTGLAVLSRYPLSNVRVVALPKYNLLYKKTSRVAQVMSVDLSSTRLNLVNLHLDNRLNTTQKIEQMRPVLTETADLSGPLMVGGDFNTGNFFWVNHVFPLPYLQRQRSAVVGAMEEAGFFTPFGGRATFDFLGLRLDWVFLRGPRVTASGVTRLGFSDHHALWLRASMP